MVGLIGNGDCAGLHGVIAVPPLIAQIGPLRFQLRAVGVGLAPRFVGTPLPAPGCAGVVSIAEPGAIVLLLDHRGERPDDGPVYAEFWRPLDVTETPLQGLVLIAPSASGRAPTFHVDRLSQLVTALLNLVCAQPHSAAS